MDPVVHFEMPYEDRQRMVDFYKKTFGWQANLLGEEMGSYAVMHTAETDEQNMIKENGRINGGFFKKSEKHAHPSVVIAVQDIQAAMQKVTDAGGSLVYGENQNGPDEIPGIGLYISFIDTEGNTVSMLQPKGM